MANHVRWCKNNPKREYYAMNSTNSIEAMRKSNIENRESRSAHISKLHKEGVYKNAPRKCAETVASKGGYKHTKETKKKISDSLSNKEYQRVCKKTHTFVCKRGRVFKFDSSWEDALAIRLDQLDLFWDRPSPISYELEGKERKYYADFYLPEYDLYLDPKNSYAQEQQKEKIEILHTIIRLIILGSLKECVEFKIEQHI